LRILLQKLNSFGDCVSCTPIPHALKDKYPNCHITMLTSEDYVDVFSKNPYIDTLKVTPSVHAHGGHIYKAYDSYLARELSSNIDDYDVLYDLNTLTFWGEYRHTGLSLTEHYAAMAEVYPLEDRRYEVYLDDATEEKKFKDLHPEIHSILNENPLIIHTAAGWDLKAMPWFKWLDVFDYLHKEMEVRPVIFVGSDDSKVPKHMEASLTDKLGTVHQAINLDIKTQCWLIDQAYMYIGPDSGPMHLAGATSTPIMAYYAGTSQYVAPPRSDKWVTMQSDASCGVPCGIPICQTHELCAKMIEPWHIAKAILTLDQAIKEDKPIRQHYRGIAEAHHYFYKWEHIGLDVEDEQFESWMDKGISLDPNWKIE